MIKLNTIDGKKYWIKAENIILVGEEENGSVIVISEFGELQCIEPAAEIAQAIENYSPIASYSSVPLDNLDSSLWKGAPAITVTSDAVEVDEPSEKILANSVKTDELVKEKRHAKQGESIEITGVASRHDLEVGAVVITAFDAEVDGTVVAAGQFVGLADYVVLNIPKFETIIMELEEEPEAIEPPYKLVKRVAEAGETIQVIGNNGSHNMKIGERATAVADAMRDKSVVALGKFIPYDDYTVVEFT
jgi:hypothetical protein